MAELFILVGIPGCGKSTFANHLSGKKVSSDAIRERLTGDATDQTQNHKVFQRFHWDIEDALTHNVDVIADSTGLDGFARKNLRDIAERTGAKTTLVLFKNNDAAIRRNQQRERVVPAEAMVRMIQKYEKALIALAQETYDNRIVIREYE